jgi:hypothetical protein
MANREDALAELAFRLEYDGPALQTPEMSVRDLAPALMATADLFQEVNRVLRPTDPDVSVNIRATSTGSFDINLTLIYLAAVATLTSPEAVATTNLMQILHSTVGLIQFIKRKGRWGVKKVAPVEADPGAVEVTFGDNASATFPKAVLDLERNISVRRNLSEITKPLHRQGIETVRYQREEIIIGEIDKQDVSAFDAAPEAALPSADQPLESERDALLSIRSLIWEGDKWRFTDGESTFAATISDEAFLEHVRSGEKFSVFDNLRCRLRQTQWQDESGKIKSTYEIVRVYEHLAPPDQGSLFAADEGTESE